MPRKGPVPDEGRLDTRRKNQTGGKSGLCELFGAMVLESHRGVFWRVILCPHIAMALEVRQIPGQVSDGRQTGHDFTMKIGHESGYLKDTDFDFCRHGVTKSDASVGANLPVHGLEKPANMVLFFVIQIADFGGCMTIARPDDFG